MRCLALSLLLAACAAPPPAVIRPAPDALAEARAVVEGFGARLHLVSLLAPAAADQIRAQYANYVAPALLDAWASDPLTAPGRLTSSPWPDRIEIGMLTLTSAGSYVAEAELVEAASTGDTARIRFCSPLRILTAAG